MTRPGQAHRVRPRLDQARLALALLTRLPVGRIGTAPPMGASAWAWPLAGAVVGLAQALVLALPLAAPVAAGLAVASGLALTGALHEDGLADLADGLSGGRDPAGRLAIMKDSRIGAHGAAALGVALGLRWTALTLLAGGGTADAALALAAAGAASRGLLPAMLLRLPLARAGGFAAAARAGLTPAGAAVAALTGAAMLLAAGPWALPLAALAAAGIAALALRRLGGITGDVLGAAQVVAELAALVVLTA